jgi:hypothetical protein
LEVSGQLHSPIEVERKKEKRGRIKGISRKKEATGISRTLAQEVTVPTCDSSNLGGVCISAARLGLCDG